MGRKKRIKSAAERIRKPTAPKTIWHKDDSQYERREKHPKGTRDYLSGTEDDDA